MGDMDRWQPEMRLIWKRCHMRVGACSVAALFISAIVPVSSRAQSSDPVFTRDELLRATTFMVGADEARRIVDLFLGPGSTPPPASQQRSRSDSFPERNDPRDKEFRFVGGISYTDDTLILLSLLSPETESKVEKYRARLRTVGSISPEAEAAWQARRAGLSADEQVKKWLAGVQD
jgi:hypothetical protein